MVETRASSKSSGPNVNTSTSGPNAKASASSTDSQGKRWTETSESQPTAAETIVETVRSFIPSSKSSSPSVSTLASGPNVKPSASSTDSHGKRWTETSKSKQKPTGTIIERVSGFNDGSKKKKAEGCKEEGDKNGGWSFISKSKKAGDDDGDELDEGEAEDEDEYDEVEDDNVEGYENEDVGRQGAHASAGKETYVGAKGGRAVARA
jgi:hypothetical protein